MAQGEIDTTNKFLVGVQGDRVRVLMPPPAGAMLTRADALILAVYLVELAETVSEGPTFEEVREAVQQA